MLCRATPYEGQEPYIFFSYCRQNMDTVYPMIERLAAAGFRIWYDDGIHPGEDWPEIIADHINRCTACIAAVTEEFAGSHNCKNEMNYVVGRGMIFVPVIMTDFPMTPGMSYMLSGSQYIKKYEFSQEEQFYKRLLESRDLRKCQGAVPLVLDKPNPVNKGGDDDILDEPDPAGEGGDDGILDEPDPAGEGGDDDVTEIEGGGSGTILMGEKGNQTGGESVAALICVAEAKIFEVYKKTTRIGRNADSDIVLRNMTVGSFHATIGRESRGYYLRDEDSRNGTWLDGDKIAGMKPVPLGSFAKIAFAEEEFIFVSGEFARRLLESGRFATLYCVETGETKFIERDTPLGRDYVWPKGALSDKHTSHLHCTIILKDNGYKLVVRDQETTNGTYLNGSKLSPGEQIVLKDNDMIRFGHVYHIQFHLQALVKGEEK